MKIIPVEVAETENKFLEFIRLLVTERYEI